MIFNYIKKVYFIAITLLVFWMLSPSVYAEKSASQIAIPPQIKRAEKTILKIYVGDKKGSSAVRISEDLILSAAHCFRGYDGLSRYKRASFYSNGKKHDLKIIETGQFQPKKGKMADWVILMPVDGVAPLADIALADFPSNKEISDVLKRLGNFEKRGSGVPIWSVTYPGFTLRIFPRSGSNGKDVFVSRGYLKSDYAYKKNILLSALKSQLYDEDYIFSYPEFNVDVKTEWGKLEKDNLFKGIYKIYQLYENDGDSILYHTADYSNGSSGGGFFIEDTGDLIGIVSMGTHLGPRYNAFFGIGQLYRIDSICRQSNVLSKLEKCKQTIGK